MNGILNIYKEKGYTSHDVVAKLRGICHQKKIGHTGTLDPQAEGVLPVCLGTATKVCDLLTDKEKEYEAVLLLGTETDTQDTTGTVLAQAPVCCSPNEVQQVIASFTGIYQQLPPMYSALKVNGKKLYELAREGIEVERKPRPVQIFSITIEKIELPRVRMRVHCSKGTYIRTLCHDIGRRLGCGGCMEELLRTRVGIFHLEQAKKLSEIQKLADEKRLEEILMPPDKLFLDCPAAIVKSSYHKLLENGNRLPVEAFLVDGNDIMETKDRLRVYRKQEDRQLFFGIYTWEEIRGDYKPLKIFWQRDNKI